MLRPFAGLYLGAVQENCILDAGDAGQLPAS